MNSKKNSIITFLCLFAVIIMFAGCFPIDTRLQKNTMFIGIDVSGSFYNSAVFDNAIRFTAFYIYAHLNGLGEFKEPRALFVGSIGGETANEPKAFHPIHDFKDKSLKQIEQNLREWFPKSNRLTDFNIFFEKIASTVQKNNLALSPINVVLITDGIPDVANRKIEKEVDRYKSLKFDSLAYLSRDITLRVLYPSAVVSRYWEKYVKSGRVKLWVVERDVLIKKHAGWVNQMEENTPPAKQEKLLLWIKENIDVFVRGRNF